ncbi:Hsp20/alpha crystallin family protein [Kallotenue papyrolyticum]|uniref:Hsp20/alpha crystallin family protein n=1 Tax=Kallotenue papyrolyticum TaxID=1325125 RepID=UPI0004924FB0|nr:Hsp20/alpha crystallin family protein [Kallotenue papyrolyticum]
MNRVIVLRRSYATAAIQRELEELFRRQWGRPSSTTLQHRSDLWQPAADVYETESAYIVLLELAGMRDAQIEVTLTEGALFVHGRRPELHPRSAVHFHQLAINEGPFQCVVYVPGPVDDERVEAVYDDGLLTITLPKRLPQRTRIDVVATGDDASLMR